MTGTLYAALDRLGAEGLIELDREEMVVPLGRRQSTLGGQRGEPAVG